MSAKFTDGANPGAEPALLREMYRKMYMIRAFETACAENYGLGMIRGFLHLYSGQEAIAVGSLSSLRDDDIVVTHYRDHGHAIARGLETKNIMAELFGRTTGVSGGKGGSMHLFDVQRSFMGGHAIVGAQLPLAAGLALSIKYRQQDRIAVVFFGDGAVSQGTFHETMNLAALWKLPLLFFLENNLYGMGTSVNLTRAGGHDIYTTARNYGIEGLLVDGMDVLAVKEVTQRVTDRIRSGGGPALIEAKTFRFEGHSMADPTQYRNDSEVQQWRKRDPIKKFPDFLLERDLITEQEIEMINTAVDKEIGLALEYAHSSPVPDADQLLKNIYA